jgi:hypothetical protein
MRNRTAKKLSAVADASLPTAAPTPPTAVASGPHPVGTTLSIPASDREAAQKAVTLIREIGLALGEADFAVAMAEARRNELRVEYQKQIQKHTENMKVIARIVGIDIEGPGQWDFNGETMAFTRKALVLG